MPAPPPPSRVLTFNIGRGAVGARWGPSPPGATFERLDEVAEVLARLAPSVAALQEVHRDDVPELVRLLAERHAVEVVAAFAPALGDDHPKLARLADPTRRCPFGLALVTTGPITCDQVVALPFDGQEDRVAQVVGTELGGVPVTVVNAHLSTRGGGPAGALRAGSPRSAQTDAVLALAAEQTGPVIALGDWNQEGIELAIAVRRTGLRRRLRFASDPWAATTLRGNGIDHVLVGGGIRRRYRGVERATVSDHRPVLVSVDLPR